MERSSAEEDTSGLGAAVEPSRGASPSENGVIVEATGVTRVYRLGRSEVTALDGVDLRVRTGEFVAIRGRSGSGKTTLLNIIGGLDRPDSGTVLLGGWDIARLSERELVSLRRHQVGFVFQSFGLLPQFSAHENVELILRLAGLPRARRHDRAVECLTMVGLEQRMHHRPYELSGGQQQRLCIARAIANRPMLILADEPTGELDSRTGREILSLFRQIVALEDSALVVATHDPVVDDFATAVYELDDGQLTHSSHSGEAPDG
jgi:putative ABC transport system ATP-binding protein